MSAYRQLSYESITSIHSHLCLGLRILSHTFPPLPNLKLQIERLYYGKNWFRIDNTVFTLSMESKQCIGSTNLEKLDVMKLTVYDQKLRIFLLVEYFQGPGSLEDAYKYLLNKLLKDKTVIHTVTLNWTVHGKQLAYLEEAIPYPLKSIEFELYQHSFCTRPIFKNAEKAVMLCELSDPVNRISHLRVHYETDVWAPVPFGLLHADFAHVFGRRHYTMLVHDTHHATQCLHELRTSGSFVEGTMPEIRNTNFNVCYTIPNIYCHEQECNVYITETTEITEEGKEKTTYLLHAKQNPIGHATQ